MCDGTTNQASSSDGAMMASGCIGPLSHLTSEQLHHEMVVTHQRVHAQLDALDAVYGPGATATLRAALNAQWAADGEEAHRVGNARASAEDLLAMVSTELELVATELPTYTDAAVAVVDEGLGRYSKAKVPQWAKDASVAVTKAHGATDRLVSMAERVAGIVKRRGERR